MHGTYKQNKLRNYPIFNVKLGIVKHVVPYTTQENLEPNNITSMQELHLSNILPMLHHIACLSISSWYKLESVLLEGSMFYYIHIHVLAYYVNHFKCPLVSHLAGTYPENEL